MQNSEALRVIWDGESQGDCVEVCRELKEAGISYKVAQQPLSRSIRMRMNWRFQVCVLGSDYESARAALGLSTGEDDKVADQAFEIPESIGPIGKSGGPDDKNRGGSYIGPWHPEDATVEVWSQVATDDPTIVELALRENLIHYTLQPAENGTCKLFVLPEDEPRAREIVREIEKGEPPS